MDLLKKNYCPVCGFNLGFAPWVGDSPSDEICPCCGIQYGYTDYAGGDINKRHLIYTRWRNQWIKEKMPWKGIDIEPPDNWNPIEQLKNII
jgi:hypothetical protein